MWKEKISHSASRMAEMMAGRFNDPFAARVSNHFLDLPNLRPPSPRDPDRFLLEGWAAFDCEGYDRTHL